MSLVNSYKTTGGVAAGTYALGFTPTVGNTVIMCGHMTAASNTLTGATLGSGRSFTQHDVVADALSSENVYCLTRVVQSGDASSVTFTTSAGNMFFYVLEVSGVLTPEATGFDAATHVNNGSGTTHTTNFISATGNEFALSLNRYSGSIGTISGITAGYTQLANGRAGTEFFYSNNIGAAGSKNFAWTSSSIINSSHIYAFKSAVTDPTVSTVSNETTVEGGANTHTVTLSGPTNRANTPYSITLAGVTATGGGVDFTSALASLTFGSSGVTFDGTQLLVPNAVTTFPIVVATVDDLLDEASETYTLTVGGTAGTGTITDDDAPPVVTFSDGVESFGVVTCVATLGAVSGKDVSFQVDTTNGTKTAGTHYTAIVAQTVTIPAGSLTAAITVNTL